VCGVDRWILLTNRKFASYPPFLFLIWGHDSLPLFKSVIIQLYLLALVSRFWKQPFLVFTMDDKCLEETATPIRSIQKSTVIATPPEVLEAVDTAAKIITLAPAAEAVTKEAAGDEEIEYPGPFALSIITIALALAIFLTALVCHL
jgi:hypothetical protein